MCKQILLKDDSNFADKTFLYVTDDMDLKSVLRFRDPIHRKGPEYVWCRLVLFPMLSSMQKYNYILLIFLISQERSYDDLMISNKIIAHIAKLRITRHVEGNFHLSESEHNRYWHFNLLSIKVAGPSNNIYYKLKNIYLEVKVEQF